MRRLTAICSIAEEDELDDQSSKASDSAFAGPAPTQRAIGIFILLKTKAPSDNDDDEDDFYFQG
jgi:hypothetical protein